MGIRRLTHRYSGARAAKISPLFTVNQLPYNFHHAAGRSPNAGEDSGALPNDRFAPRGSFKRRKISHRQDCERGLVSVDCSERSRLLKLCADTMHVYASTQALIELQELTGKADTEEEYQDSLIALKMARIQLDLATYLLEQHETSHHCYPVQRD
jgi:hypothetical protein